MQRTLVFPRHVVLHLVEGGGLPRPPAGLLRLRLVRAESLRSRELTREPDVYCTIQVPLPRRGKSGTLQRVVWGALGWGAACCGTLLLQLLCLSFHRAPTRRPGRDAAQEAATLRATCTCAALPDDGLRPSLLAAQIGDHGHVRRSPTAYNSSSPAWRQASFGLAVHDPRDGALRLRVMDDSGAW